MTRHVDDLPGLLADSDVYYSRRRLGETAAYAFEWINAFGHLAPDERRGLLLHGGTPAQLHLGAQQRFSRDVDLIGSYRGRIEHVLDAIARRYDGRLFRWEETPVESAEMPLQRFSAYFRNAAGAEIPLKIDVTYLPVTLDTGPVRLAQSAAYRPRDPADVVETLTPQASSPTSYRRWASTRSDTGASPTRSATPSTCGNSSTTSASSSLGPAICRGCSCATRPASTRGTPREGSRARRMRASTTRTASRWWLSPPPSSHTTRIAPPTRTTRATSSTCDPDWVVTENTWWGRPRCWTMRRRRRSWHAGPWPRGAVRSRSPSFLPALARIRQLASAFAGSAPLRAALRARFDTAADPTGWEAPASSRRLYRARPSAAIAAWVAANVVAELRELTRSGHFSFEATE